MNLTALLLQTEAPPTIPTGPTSPTSPSPGNMWFLPALLVAFFVFIWMSSRSSRKREQRERDAMYARMGKNDRVLTIGGVIGTVLSVKENEVVVKVDESTNTKMTFLKSAIQRILSDEGSPKPKGE
jgi:preprotein translocase subunit YajC